MRECNGIDVDNGKSSKQDHEAILIPRSDTWNAYTKHTSYTFIQGDADDCTTATAAKKEVLCRP